MQIKFDFEFDWLVDPLFPRCQFDYLSDFNVTSYLQEKSFSSALYNLTTWTWTL